MKQLACTLLVYILLFSACKKNNQANGKVNIRIENGTTLLLEDVKIADKVYGNIITGSTSGYAVITTPIYAGYCNFKINNQDVFAGYGVCGTPPPPAFAPGYYTFKVETALGYFSVVVTRD